jgi:hypothetical protein
MRGFLGGLSSICDVTPGTRFPRWPATRRRPRPSSILRRTFAFPMKDRICPVIWKISDGTGIASVFRLELFIEALG